MQASEALSSLPARLTAALSAAHPELPAERLHFAETDARFGDFQTNAALSCAKSLGEKPRELAERLAQSLQSLPWVAQAEVAGPGFLNLRLHDSALYASLDALSSAEATRAALPEGYAAKRTLVDFSSPNIAKRMHVGHIRSTILGDALSRLLAYVEVPLWRDNHIGDWGTHFGMLIAQAEKEGLEVSALTGFSVEAQEALYRRARQSAAEDATFADLARERLSRLHAGDVEALKLWRSLCDTSREELDAMYARLQVAFDETRGESAYHAALPGVVERLLKQGIAREDAAAVGVFFQELETLSDLSLSKQDTPFLVRKADGAFLYATTDIATLLERCETKDYARVIYVVDSRQSLHFRQLFEVGAQLGVEAELLHIGFGTILGADGTPLKTRDGEVVALSALLDEAKRKALALMEAQGVGAELEDREALADKVALAAIKYADLRQHRLSDYRFDLDKMVAFQGDAGPYLLYAYARIRSLLANAPAEDVEAATPDALATLAEGDHAPERQLALRLAAWPETVAGALASYEVHRLCEHLFQLAKLFSAFYAACPILKADTALRRARLALAQQVAKQLAQGLCLLGMPTVERM